MKQHYRYIKDENRYVLEDGPPIGNPFRKEHRTFTQAAVLHTSEDTPLSLTRAYDLEGSFAIADNQLKLGARLRGQELGEVSGGNHLVDDPPEHD